MAERKTVLTIERISDHSCGSYQVGEIDSIPDECIKKYIDDFGEFGYSELTNWLARATTVAYTHIRDRRHRSAQTAQFDVRI